MLYKLLILSDEVDDFVREITIDSDATFLDLHNALLDSIGFSKDQMTSFFLCSYDWEKEQEITLVEMDSGSDYDNLVMSETVLADYILDEEQKLLFIFDYLLDRAFFIELKEIIPGKTLISAVCSMSKGLPPTQMIDDNDEVAVLTTTTTIDETFYGDEGFDLEELDEEGFSDLDMEDAPIATEEPNF